MFHLWKRSGWAVLGLVVLMAGWLLPVQAAQDEVRMRNGTVLKGRVITVDKVTVMVRTDEGVQELNRSDVAAIFFDRAVQVSTDFWGAPPSEYTAKSPLKIVRVIALRRITRNRATEEGKFKPEFARLSGDGSKIAFWARKSGIYTINSDGTDRALLISPDNNNTDRTSFDPFKFEMSPDGKVLYWQGVHPIYRINSDGTNEKILVREGGEYNPMRLRQGGKRIFFSSRGGIFSIDTEGKGDYAEIITNNTLAKLWEIDGERCMLGLFDVSEDGKRITFVVGGYPKSKTGQLMAINSDGTGLRRITETDFCPTMLMMTPDGNRVVFSQPAEQHAYIVNWDGSNLQETPIPASYHALSHTARISPDSQWYAYHTWEYGWNMITTLDGNGRFDPLQTGPWDYYENSLFLGMFPPNFSADLHRFVTVSRYWGGGKPRQLVVGDVNPSQVADLPILSDIEFSQDLSMNPQLPQHKGTVKVRIKKGASDVERVVFMLGPVSKQVSTNPVKWDANLGWNGLQGDHLLRDDGKGGDEVAGDGIFSTDNLMPVEKQSHWSFNTLPGHHLLRIVAHDDQNAVIVDVDGVDIK